MKDMIKTILDKALQEPGKPASGELSDKLYLNFMMMGSKPQLETRQLVAVP